MVKYRVPEECKCDISIFFVEEGQEQAIRGANFTSSFGTKGNSKVTNEFDGPLMLGYINH